MQNGFLPISRKDMEEAGIKQLDFVYVCGDAYVDHPSFGHAIISRILQAHGYTVGIIAQPDYRDKESVTILGEPRLGFLVSGAEKQEQTTEKSAPEAKTDVISESESQEKSSEEFSNTVENTSSKSVTKPKKRESVQTDSMILFVLIAALLIALILLGTLLKKRKK